MLSAKKKRDAIQSEYARKRDNKQEREIEREYTRERDREGINKRER